MKSLKNPPADKRKIRPIHSKVLMYLPYKQALEALADFDGPTRSLLERIVSTEPEHAHVLMNDWRKEAKGILNVIYKLNGLKQRWTEV